MSNDTLRPLEPISLVIPVYNEEEVIEKVVRDFYHKIIEKIPGSEFIVAEDGSTDGTRNILQKLSEELPITFVYSDQRKGYTKAVLDALKLPTKNIILFSDSDGQHEPNDFWTMAERLKDHDIVVGYKYPRLDPWLRVVISKIYQMVNFFLFGIRFHDINCSFRLIKKEALNSVIEEISLLPSFVSSEMVIRAIGKGYSVVEMPVTHYKREYGGSRGLPAKKIPLEVLKLLRGLLTLRKTWRVKSR